MPSKPTILRYCQVPVIQTIFPAPRTLGDMLVMPCRAAMLTHTAHQCTVVPAQGLIFCVATDSGVLKLYDIRSYEKGPFDTFTVRL